MLFRKIHFLAFLPVLFEISNVGLPLNYEFDFNYRVDRFIFYSSNTARIHIYTIDVNWFSFDSFMYVLRFWKITLTLTDAIYFVNTANLQNSWKMFDFDFFFNFAIFFVFFFSRTNKLSVRVEE